MPWGGPYTQLPKELQLALQAVPTGTITSNHLASGDTELENLSVSNTTGGDLTITVQDRQASPQALYTAVTIKANSATLLISDAPILFKSGIDWTASGPGLVASARGRSVLGLTQGAASSTTNNLPVPV